MTLTVVAVDEEYEEFKEFLVLVRRSFRSAMGAMWKSVLHNDTGTFSLVLPVPMPAVNGLAPRMSRVSSNSWLMPH